MEIMESCGRKGAVSAWITNVVNMCRKRNIYCLTEKSLQRQRLTQRFFARSVHEVAPDLIGATFFVDGVGGLIVEVEAYHHTDPAAHSYGGPTAPHSGLLRAPRDVSVHRSSRLHW